MNLCKIKPHLYNKTNSFDFSMLLKPVFVRRFFFPTLSLKVYLTLRTQCNSGGPGKHFFQSCMGGGGVTASWV